MEQHLAIYNSRTTAGRIVLAGAILAALIFAWCTVRWQLGNMLAALTPNNSPNAAEIAELAVSMDPSDPLPRWLLSVKQREDFSPASIDASVISLENAVRLAPNDFRWWVELGRAYEQAERPVEAESALLKAVDLAPNYTFPRWQLGNFYLRNDREQEAFVQLSKATEKSIVYRNQVFSLVWDFYQKDATRVEQVAATDPDTRVTLALFFALRDSPQDALRVWNTLSEEEKQKRQVNGRTIAQSLLRSRFISQAFEFAKQTGFDPDAEPERVTNAGFEGSLGEADATMFGWRIYRDQPRVELVSDTSVKHSGQRSLKVSFKNYLKPELYNAVQLVRVEPGVKYRLSYWVRTENLKSGGTPFFDITDARTDQVLAGSEAFANGTNDWQQYHIDFTTPAVCDGVFIKMARVPCGETCPISGMLWLDDFDLSRI